MQQRLELEKQNILILNLSKNITKINIRYKTFKFGFYWFITYSKTELTCLYRETKRVISIQCGNWKPQKKLKERKTEAKLRRLLSFDICEESKKCHQQDANGHKSYFNQ